MFSEYLMRKDELWKNGTYTNNSQVQVPVSQIIVKYKYQFPK